MGFDFFEVSYSLTDDHIIRNLNKKYRRINKATDVLSFPQYRFQNGELLEPVILTGRKIPLGDIVISAETIKRRSRGKTGFETYLLRTVIHGILHLLGFDHIRRKDRKTMRSIENILFKLYRKDFSL
ncbi:MAG: rRNA maturation RNase YbeY [Deltaproteobacteria bacterium]|nr:rRNA maturation RNase YbeY [Deltaproteobacteria bacterium]